MRQKLGSILAEALIVLVLGGLFALAANKASPRGLSLTRDYFGRPVIEHPVVVTPATNLITAEATNANVSTTGAAPDQELSELAKRLNEKGLSLVDGETVEELYHDPQYEQELIVFIDARNDRHYAEGHIPAAYQLDRYYPEKYLPAVLPACLGATRVVVYCTGGKCEDSEYAALMLVDAGVPAGNISVYAGGITDWEAHKRPVEIGARRSGTLKGTQ